ncbi:MAG: hypothetical protein KF716_16635 [Anaerolineae bacterium]|nr:hypothetical protein [Anaerolineae bacterium]
MPDVRIIEESARDMAEALARSAEYLGDVANKLRKIADIIDGGALVNRAGQQWSEALRGQVANSVLYGQGLLEELTGDVRGALGDIEGADTDGAANFG